MRKQRMSEVEKVLRRDDFRCVRCGSDKDLTAHHLMERRLFTKQESDGYLMDNLVTVCPECHILAEATIVTPYELRRAAGITRTLLPEHLYHDVHYDKWGNVYKTDSSDPQRIAGELFYDESVQKILIEYDQLQFVIDSYRYPRTYHLPQSVLAEDDRRLRTSLREWEGTKVVITEKLDGQNVTLYWDGVHGRGMTDTNVPSKLKQYWSQSISYDLPRDMRLCVESMVVPHTIDYGDSLEYDYYLLSAWTRDTCIGWDETTFFAEYYGLGIPPILYQGPFNQDALDLYIAEVKSKEKMEGLVVRPYNEFSLREWKTRVGKYVKAEFQEARLTRLYGDRRSS